MSGATASGAFTVKPISSVIDPTSFFSPDLFALCMWMADYYFANPADCLAAALPPLMKTRARPQLIWRDDSRLKDDSLRRLFKLGGKVSPGARQAIDAERGGLLKQLIRDGAIVEQWSQVHRSLKSRVVGYRCCRAEGWAGYFRTRRISPDPFAGVRTRAQLLTEGWTTHYLGRAVTDGLLETVAAGEVPFEPDLLAPRDDVEQIVLNQQQQDVVDKILPSLRGDGVAS